MIMGSFKEFKELPEEQLIKEYDATVKGKIFQPENLIATEITAQFYLSEIERRNQNKQTNEILKMNKRMKTMTCWMTIMTATILLTTIVNLFLFLFKT